MRSALWVIEANAWFYMWMCTLYTESRIPACRRYDWITFCQKTFSCRGAIIDTVVFSQKFPALSNESIHNYKPVEEVVGTGCQMTDEHKAGPALSILPIISSRKRKSVKDAFWIEARRMVWHQELFPLEAAFIFWRRVLFSDCLPIFVRMSEACEHLFKSTPDCWLKK